MATTEVSICNSAIAKVGGAFLVSLDDATPRARLFKEQYPKCRDEVLYAHPWKFALKRAAPTPIVEAPGSLYEYRFQLPADCLRVVELDGKNSVWSTEAGYLIADHPDPLYRYIARITDTSKFTPGFAETLAAKLAADTCYSLVQSVTLRAQLIQEYEKQLRLVRSYSAQEGSSRRVYADSWLDAHQGGSDFGYGESW